MIYGTGKRKKVTKYKVEDICGCCNTAAEMNIVKVYDYAHIFFIPIFSFNTKYFVECPKCGAAREMTKEEFKKIKLDYKEKAKLLKEQQTANPTAEPTTPETKVVEDTPTVMEKLIWQDIDKVVQTIVSKDIVGDSEKFNNFFSSLKASLLKKYGDGERVDKTLNKYFKLQ